MSRIGVNAAISNAGRIKVGDYRSAIELSLTNTAGDPPTELEYIRLTKSYEEYVDITDYTIADGKVSLRLPAVPSGFYRIEIKDAEGRIYPAEGAVSIHVVKSIEGGKEVTFTKYKDVIIGEIPAVVVQHMTDNTEQYKGDKGATGPIGPQGEQGVQGPQGEQGPKGDKGDTTLAPPKIFTRDEYDTMTDHDPNTLYFISEVTT